MHAPLTHAPRQAAQGKAHGKRKVIPVALRGAVAFTIIASVGNAFKVKKRHNPVWSRRPPLRLKLPGLARDGVGDSGRFRQRGRVGAAHTARWAACHPGQK